MKFASAALMTVCAAFSTGAAALSNSAHVPVFLYHSGDVGSPCDYSSYASVALAQDLEKFHSQGITVVPLYWLAEWAVGLRDGSTLPAKVVAITTDDGNDLDWIDLYLPNYPCGPTRKSFRTVIQEFKAAHPEYPYWSPHVSTFVVASPVTRQYFSGGPSAPQYWNDSWWSTAQASGFMEVYNHGTDHDAVELQFPVWDSAINRWVPIGRYVDGVGRGYGTNQRIIDNFMSKMAITESATFISGKIGQWPDLFAYPYGNAWPAMLNYFANFQGEHGTLAAFTTSGQYVSRSSNRWQLGRFIWKNHWSTPGGMDTILAGAVY